MTDVAQVLGDGRRARRERGRLAVIDALVDLVREGQAPPSTPPFTPPATEAIAERAGVSVASLFRYFDGLEDLQQQTTARFFDRYASLIDIPDIGTGSLDGRIDRYVSTRITLYETIAPIARFARAQSFERPHLASSLGDVRRRHADSTRQHFAGELDLLSTSARDDRVALITSLTSFESWDLLQHDFGRTRFQIRRAWTWSIATICAC